MWELLLTSVFSVMIFKDTPMQRKHLHMEAYFYHCFGEWDALLNFFTLWPSDLGPGWPALSRGCYVVSQAILRAAVCFHFPLSLGRERATFNWMQHCLHFLCPIPPCFPSSSKEIPGSASLLLPVMPQPCHSSSLGCSKPAGKEKHPYDIRAGWQGGGGGWRGPCSPG